MTNATRPPEPRRCGVADGAVDQGTAGRRFDPLGSLRVRSAHRHHLPVHETLSETVTTALAIVTK